MDALVLVGERAYPLTLRVGLRGGFQVLHCVEQAALEDPGAAALPHDPDAGLFVQFGRRAAVLVVGTGLAQSPTPLSFIFKFLGLADDFAAGL